MQQAPTFQLAMEQDNSQGQLPLSNEDLHKRVFEMLRVCLYLSVQCPEKVKREKFV
jgi:hypothetical protein